MNMKNLFQYPGKVEPVFSGPETPQLDKWFSLLSEPSRSIKSLAMAVVLAASGNFFVTPTSAPAETVTVDKYYQDLYKPTFRKELTNHNGSSFSIDPASLLNPEAPQLDKWYQDFSRPLLKGLELSSALKFSFTIIPATPLPSEQTQLDKWYQELSSTVKTRSGLSSASKFNFSMDFGNLTTPEIPQLDKWYSELSKPQLESRRLSESQRDHYAFDLKQPVAPFGGWFNSLSAPVYRVKHFDPPAQLFQKDFIPEATQLDKWFVSLELPLRAKPSYSIYNSAFNFSTKPTTQLLNLSKTIRDAILADSQIVALLGSWQGVASVHTRRPAPSEADMPMIMISGDISTTDEDSLTSYRPVVVKDVICYGDQPLSYRDVEEVGALMRALFHRKRHLLSIDGWHIIDVIVEGPFVAPTDDDKTCARGVTLTIRLLDLRSV